MQRTLLLLFVLAIALSEVAMSQTVVENPLSSQTINQPAGTSFTVNGVGGLVWPNLFRIAPEGNAMVFRDLSQSNAWYMIMRNDGNSTADVQFFAGFTNGGTILPNPSGTGSIGVFGNPWGSISAINGAFQNLAKGISTFKIDHPLDPLHKFLLHSVVESPDMKDIYDGVVILDENGDAWVQLPDWFEALNEDFRYQLTPIGAPGSGLYIAREVSGNKFKISGGKPGLKVSWQVTGIRHDALANAHRVKVEEIKPPEMQGKYLYPDAFRSQNGAQVAGEKPASTSTQNSQQEPAVGGGNR